MGSRAGRERQVEDEAPALHTKSVLRDYTETILVCVVFVIFSRTFVFQQSKIPSGSMEDTLLIGDYIMVNRWVYAPTASDWEKKLLPFRDIRRGDVVVFKQPREPEVDYIKRVIGLPGDTVEVSGGYVYVNGERREEPYVSENYRMHEDYPRTRVPDGEFFVMGDHRNSSSDSRSWGTVPQHLMKGRALLIWWSYEEEHGSTRLSVPARLRSWAKKLVTMPTKTRWRRCFSLIR